MDIRAIEHAYKRYAAFYDLCFGAVLQSGRRAIVAKMACGPGERILEVGVGTGLDARITRPVNLFDFSTMVEARKNKQGAAEIAAPAFAPS